MSGGLHGSLHFLFKSFCRRNKTLVNQNPKTSPLQQAPGDPVEPQDAAHGAHCLRDQLAPICGARTAEDARLHVLVRQWSSIPVLKTTADFLTTLATSDVDDHSAGWSSRKRSYIRKKIKQRGRVRFPSRLKVAREM
jgi:hypothetical protein